MGRGQERRLLEHPLTEPIVLGEQLLGLLDESARTSTYKPALLLAILDRVVEHQSDGRLPVRSLAERVIELYWPQTLAYPQTEAVLLQNQGGQAVVVRDIARFRDDAQLDSRTLPEGIRRGPRWDALADRVEFALAEWPIPRLQRPYAPFVYDFDWPWAENGRWSKAAYRASSRVLTLRADVAPALVALGPLLRPFITRWWTEKAAQLNPRVPAAQSLMEFEAFLFGRDRVALGRVAEGLLDLQRGACFYCGRTIGRDREIDHFVPWSACGDDGLDNLVAACRRCNNAKRATLAGPRHLSELFERRSAREADLQALAHERQWPRDPARSAAAIRGAYVPFVDERPLWVVLHSGPALISTRDARNELAALLA